jgi:hypothetical protein
MRTYRRAEPPGGAGNRRMKSRRSTHPFLFIRPPPWGPPVLTAAHAIGRQAGACPFPPRL